MTGNGGLLFLHSQQHRGPPAPGDQSIPQIPRTGRQAIRETARQLRSLPVATRQAGSGHRSCPGLLKLSITLETPEGTGSTGAFGGAIMPSPIQRQGAAGAVSVHTGPRAEAERAPGPHETQGPPWSSGRAPAAAGLWLLPCRREWIILQSQGPGLQSQGDQRVQVMLVLKIAWSQHIAAHSYGRNCLNSDKLRRKNTPLIIIPATNK